MLTLIIKISEKIERQSQDKCNFGVKMKKIWNASRICVSSLRRGHANLLCIVPILVYVLPLSEHVYTNVNVAYLFVIPLRGGYLW